MHELDNPILRVADSLLDDGEYEQVIKVLMQDAVQRVPSVVHLEYLRLAYSQLLLRCLGDLRERYPDSAEVGVELGTRLIECGGVGSALPLLDRVVQLPSFERHSEVVAHWKRFECGMLLAKETVISEEILFMYSLSGERQQVLREQICRIISGSAEPRCAEILASLALNSCIAADRDVCELLQKKAEELAVLGRILD